MSTSPADFNAKVIDEFRANGGRVGGNFESMPILLLHHTAPSRACNASIRSPTRRTAGAT